MQQGVHAASLRRQPPFIPMYTPLFTALHATAPEAGHQLDCGGSGLHLLKLSSSRLLCRKIMLCKSLLLMMWRERVSLPMG